MSIVTQKCVFLTALWLLSHQVRVSDDVRHSEYPAAAAETDVFRTSGLQQPHSRSWVQETRHQSTARRFCSHRPTALHSTGHTASWHMPRDEKHQVISGLVFYPKLISVSMALHLIFLYYHFILALFQLIKSKKMSNI